MADQIAGYPAWTPAVAKARARYLAREATRREAAQEPQASSVLQALVQTVAESRRVSVTEALTLECRRWLEQKIGETSAQR